MVGWVLTALLTQVGYTVHIIDTILLELILTHSRTHLLQNNTLHQAA